MNQTFSNKEIVKKSWGIVKSNLKIFIPILIIVWLLQIGLSSIQTISDNTIITLLLSAISWIINTLITIGLISTFLKFANGEIFNFKSVLDKKDKFIPYVIGTIYYSLIVFAGIILLIIPGIIWAIRYQFYSYLIIDKGMSPKEALAKSKEMTKGKTLKLLGFGIVLFLINILGLLALVVGLFISIPVSMLAIALVYKKLFGEDVTPEFTSPTPTQNPVSNNNMWATYRQNS